MENVCSTALTDCAGLTGVLHGLCCWEFTRFYFQLQCHQKRRPGPQNNTKVMKLPFCSLVFGHAHLLQSKLGDSAWPLGTSCETERHHTSGNWGIPCKFYLPDPAVWRVLHAVLGKKSRVYCICAWLPIQFMHECPINLCMNASSVQTWASAPLIRAQAACGA